MLFRINHSSGVPLYVQLMDQAKHAIDMGVLRPGEQLPTIRAVAEGLVMNPNTVARAYRELEHAGIIEVRHGTGAFVPETVAKPSENFRKGRIVMQRAVERLVTLGLSDEEIRRLVDNEVAAAREESVTEIPE